jgi:hypothetical protein
MEKGVGSTKAGIVMNTIIEYSFKTCHVWHKRFGNAFWLPGLSTPALGTTQTLPHGSTYEYILMY